MMIRLVQARNFRCLRYINQPLQRFQVQIGPNASGKTTFQDIIRFLGTLVSSGLEDAVRLFSSGNIQEMFWNHQGDSFELAVEWEIPEHLQHKILKAKGWDTIRYEVEIGRNEFGGATIVREFGALKKYTPPDGTLHETFMTERTSKSVRKIFGKSKDGSDTFNSELSEDGKKGWSLSLKLGEDRSALGGVPEDPGKFAVAMWLKQILRGGIQRIMLDSEEMRKMAPPIVSNSLRRYRLNANGSNLPWVLDTLVEIGGELRYTAWVEHIQTALPDIENIFVREREDIRHKYVVIRYAGGVEVPSWLVSDGTLRLLALTSLTYLVDVHSVILLEEPENGLHPQAIETVIQSLRSMYNSQVIVATHSPIFLNVCEPHELLCFSKHKGEVVITPGDQHPMLKDWQSTPNLSALFASGVLG